MSYMESRPTLDDIHAAHARTCAHINRTPVVVSRTVNEETGCDFHFKCENMQRIGAFKARGAMNAVLSLGDDEAARGVVTHSSGNHGQALAWAAGVRDIPATIVMPRNASPVKRDAVAALGGRIVLCDPTLEARERSAQKVIDATGATLIHPYNDHRVIAGQGTVAVELLADVPGLDALFVPVGGGGLLSGTLIAAKAISPRIRVIAGEPAAADDAYESWKTGNLAPQRTTQTIADGLRTALGERTFAIIRELVDDIVRVEEEEIIAATAMLWSRARLLVEPSSAVAFAAALRMADDLRGRRVGVILTGGNVDLKNLPFAP